jgi:hypothetical protein
MRTSTNVLFRFEFRSGGGNNIYIDDFRVDGLTVGVEDNKLLENSFTAFPNPNTNGKLNINFMLDEASDDASLFVTSILGQQVTEIFSGALNNGPYQFEVNTDKLSAGIYFITLRTEKQNITRKIIIN